MREKEQCPLCTAQSDGQMVQCDRCDRWYHFECVNVTADVKYVDWMCAECSDATKIERANKEVNTKVTVAEPTKDVVLSSKGSTKNKRDKQLALARIAEERQAQMKFIQQKYQILLEDESIDECTETHEEQSVRKQRTDEWLKRQQEAYKATKKCQQDAVQQVVHGEDRSNMQRNKSANEAMQICESNLTNFATQGEIQRAAQIRTSNETQYETRNSHLCTNNVYMKCTCSSGIPAKQSADRGDACTQPTLALTELNIHARRGGSNDLPQFSGNPSEWPLFISNLENSTKICGFTNQENMLRLQKALKGKALKFVGSMLMVPELMPQVLSTLKMVFGRPEVIVNSLLTKLRASPNVNMNKLETIISYALEVKNISATMLASGLHAHLNSPMLVQELIEKLPPPMRLEWANYSMPIKDVNLLSLSDWLYKNAEAASSVTMFAVPMKNEADTEKRKVQRINFQKEEVSSSDQANCVICNEKHKVCDCKTFNEAEHPKKWQLVHNAKLCRSCLKVHNLNFCAERKECGVNGCTAKHHPLLHRQHNVTETVASQYTKSSDVLYKIVPITVYGENTSKEVFAFLDDGSGPTVMKDELAEELNIKGPASRLVLQWTDESVHVEEESMRFNLDVSPVGKSVKTMTLRDVRTAQHLELPRQTLDMDEIETKFRHLRGLPVQSYYDVKASLIIGVNNSYATRPLKYREGKRFDPAAAKTRLGWAVFGTMKNSSYGTMKDSNADSMLQLHVCECDDDVSLQKLVSDKMHLDEITLEHQVRANFKPEDFPVLQGAIRRNGTAFTTRLLWKQEIAGLPDSYKMACRRLENFERKLMKDPVLQNQIQDKILDMKSKGYIRQLSVDEIHMQHPRKWYLPIFAVKNPNKPQKVRIVWDAAAEQNGVSLNKCLDKGPDLLTPLIDVLFNFRIGKIGISGDINEMYHRIFIDPIDQQSQRFLWRDCEGDRDPDEYVMTVMSFGANCSPSIAQYVKNTNAYEHVNLNPRATKSILERHYVDDMLDSVDTIEEALTLVRDVTTIHGCANFRIRGWLSNSNELLEALGDRGAEEDFCQAGNKIEQIYEADKVLGLWWKTGQDVFTFSLKFTKASFDILQGNQVPTKREFLRLLMSIFDPLGFLSFYTVQAKILLQKIWRSRTEWDEKIPDELEDEWFRWLQLLPKISQIQIPRCYFGGLDKHTSKIELHIYTDASEYAYAAVAYFRIINSENVKVSFVCSKSKVAPLRPVSIPRMELMAALLGARLSRAIINAHDLTVQSTSFWTDSQTVLQWLRGDPRTFKQFVMFRVSEIQELTDVNNWRFTSTKNNIADLATKWSSKIELSSDIWINGPDSLRNFELPETKQNDNVPSQYKEEVLLMATHVECDEGLVEYKKFGKWERLLRAMAYVRKFANAMLAKRNSNSQAKNKNNKGTEFIPHLTSSELDWSRSFLFKAAQAETFSYEIAILQKNPANLVPTSSVLRKYSPYIDENGLIRQRSRVRKSILAEIPSEDPIVLPKGHYITYLLVDFYHRKFKHVNHESVVNAVFEHFRVPGLRGLLRTIRFKCNSCKIANAKPEPPEMGMLPLARTSAFTRPFTYTGVDFFGPFLTTVGRRCEKRYGVVFTCLTSRAVHIEMAYSLSTSSCIHVVRNFIGRRGKPREFFSDNGTNLRATDKTLRDSDNDPDFKKLHAAFTAPDTSWSFIPPASPHMGDAWERVVRSIKNTLYKIVTPSTKLTDEILHNLFIEVESILNCRPLTYLSLDTADEEVLTPNHFLLGSASGNKPPGIFRAEDKYSRQNWRYSQLLADHFWKRWVAEVLPDLTGRTKWFNRVRPIQIGDVCIIVDQNLPRHQWPKGIVVNVYPGSDGQVRSALVRTASGEYHRPVAKIAVLQVRAQESLDHSDKEVNSTYSQDTGGEC